MCRAEGAISIWPLGWAGIMIGIQVGVIRTRQFQVVGMIYRTTARKALRTCQGLRDWEVLWVRVLTLI